MQVVILCGGLGTRLREETEYRPILWHIMKTYAAHGHKDFILCLGYKGEVIREFFLNYLAMTSDLTLRLGRNASVEYHSLHDEEDWSVPFVETGLKTMTGGRRARTAVDLTRVYADGLLAPIRDRAFARALYDRTVRSIPRAFLNRRLGRPDQPGNKYQSLAAGNLLATYRGSHKHQVIAFTCWLAGTILPTAALRAMLGEKPRKVKF